MKVDYLETLCNSTLTNTSDIQKNLKQLKEAQEHYLELLT
jgi:hypothetical protein